MTTLRYYHVPGPLDPDEPTRLVATIDARDMREAYDLLKQQHPEADPKRTDVESWMKTGIDGVNEYYQRPYPGCA
jgi:hypothetical protein